MAAIKDWMMDMENYTWSAIEANLNLKDTIDYVKSHVSYTDEGYVRQLYMEFNQ